MRLPRAGTLSHLYITYTKLDCVASPATTDLFQVRATIYLNNGPTSLDQLTFSPTAISALLPTPGTAGTPIPVVSVTDTAHSVAVTPGQCMMLLIDLVPVNTATGFTEFTQATFVLAGGISLD